MCSRMNAGKNWTEEDSQELFELDGRWRQLYILEKYFIKKIVKANFNCWLGKTKNSLEQNPGEDCFWGIGLICLSGRKPALNQLTPLLSHLKGSFVIWGQCGIHSYWQVCYCYCCCWFLSWCKNWFLRVWSRNGRSWAFQESFRSSIPDWDFTFNLMDLASPV